MNKYKKLKPTAILFDMDGVLVDSLDSWWKSLNEALKNYNHRELSRGEFIENFWGFELRANLNKLGIDENIGVFCNNTYKNYINNVKIFSGTKNALDRLNKYPKAVITNTPNDCAIRILSKYKIKKYFEEIITSDQINKGKPEPDIVFEACKKLNVEPDKVVLVGDTKSDVKAGKGAGCKVIGINVEADYTIKNISEIINLIES
jgi:HAD superfamily hydrolase (TIGR01509 family)